MSDDQKIDIELLYQVMSLQPTQAEVAAFFNITEGQLRRIAANDPEVRRIMEDGSARGKLSLRRVQWRQATGFGPQAVQMSIWLGKQWLGQTDKSEVDVNANVRIQGSHNPADHLLQGIRSDLLTDDERIALAELCDLIDDRGMARLTNVERIKFFHLVNKASVDPDSDPEPKTAEILLLPPPMKEAA